MEWVGAAGRGTGLEAEVQMRDGGRKHILGGDADLVRPACARGALRRKEGGPDAENWGSWAEELGVLWGALQKHAPRKLILFSKSHVAALHRGWAAKCSERKSETPATRSLSTGK